MSNITYLIVLLNLIFTGVFYKTPGMAFLTDSNNKEKGIIKLYFVF